MPLDWTPLVALLKQQSEILLMTHIRPDADGLGSQLALAEGLEQLGLKVRVVIASPLPSRYQFLDPTQTRIEPFHPPGESFLSASLVLVMDTGTWNQLGDFAPFLQAFAGAKAVVDHHRTQDPIGLSFIDTTAEATGRLAYELLLALGVSFTPSMAQHLFAALAMDTGWFRHSNATPATFHLASRLMEYGAKPTELYEQLFEAAPLGRLKLTGRAIERLQVVLNGQVAYTEIFLKDYPECFAVPGDTEDLSQIPRSVLGVEVALVFIEQPDGGTKVSFRSRSRIDVSALAERFGGGGHKLASGARVARPLSEVRQAVLKDLEASLAIG